MQRRTELLPTGYEMTITPQPWIPVSERLPETGGMVLSWDSWTGLCRVVHATDGVESKGSRAYDQDSRGNRIGFTHWMPLPEPPEVK
jgi:hypothetical protein